MVYQWDTSDVTKELNDNYVLEKKIRRRTRKGPAIEALSLFAPSGLNMIIFKWKFLEHKKLWKYGVEYKIIWGTAHIGVYSVIENIQIDLQRVDRDYILRSKPSSLKTLEKN